MCSQRIPSAIKNSIYTDDAPLDSIVKCERETLGEQSVIAKMFRMYSCVEV